MKSINYEVSNKSSSVVTVTGRAPFTIPGNCENMPLSLPDTDGIKATIQRFKREYPLISFVAVALEDENADGDATNSEDNGISKVTIEVFADSCEVKDSKKGGYVVVYGGKGYSVKADTASTAEDAIRVAFEQYSLAQ